ncbi:hypothetical protein BC828DRAFT_381650 [Blastocladiella britannica]|nr:hypothetical protein BC828DRAFT_381650 [Blastocladiella britannica]
MNKLHSFWIALLLLLLINHSHHVSAQGTCFACAAVFPDCVPGCSATSPVCARSIQTCKQCSIAKCFAHGAVPASGWLFDPSDNSGGSSSDNGDECFACAAVVPDCAPSCASNSVCARSVQTCTQCSVAKCFLRGSVPASGWLVDPSSSSTSKASSTSTSSSSTSAPQVSDKPVPVPPPTNSAPSLPHLVPPVLPALPSWTSTSTTGHGGGFQSTTSDSSKLAVARGGMWAITALLFFFC